MKKELKTLLSKKFVMITIPILVVVAILSWFISNYDLDEYSEFYFEESRYGNFVDIIEPYDTMEELNALYEKSKSISSAGAVSDSNLAQYRTSLYRFCLEGQLPYDSLVEFSEEVKYTQFHYLSSFKSPIMIYILLASLIIGGFYQTGDIMSKMSKLIYTSGEKRNKIIDRKYIVSLSVLIFTVTALDCVIALLGTMYCNTGAKYCVVFVNSSLHTLNYFQYFCLFLFNHLLALTVAYTFVYYLCVVCKNGIIPVCIIFSLLLVYSLIQSSFVDNIFFDMMIRDGFISVLYNRDTSGSVKLEKLLLYIPIVLLPLMTYALSRIFVKRADYSR